MRPCSVCWCLREGRRGGEISAAADAKAGAIHGRGCDLRSDANLSCDEAICIVRGDHGSVLVVARSGGSGSTELLICSDAGRPWREEPAEERGGRPRAVCQVRGSARAGEQEKNRCDGKEG